MFNLGIDNLAEILGPRNHTSHKKIYFYKFVADVLRDDIGILTFDLH